MGEKEKIPLEGKLAIVFTLSMIILLTTQIILRYFFGKSIAWVEEVSRYFFVWSVYCYIILAAKTDNHIRITFHLSIFSKKIQKVIITIADILWLIFNIVVVFVSIRYVASMFEYPYYSQTLGFNLVYIYMVVPLGFIFLTVRIFQTMMKRLKRQMVVRDVRADL